MSFKLKLIIVLISIIAIILVAVLFVNNFLDSKPPEIKIDERELAIKIMNGCGIPGLARDYEEYLQEKYGSYENPMFKFSEPSNMRKYIYNRSVIVVSQEIDFSVSPNNLKVLIDRTGIECWTYAIDEVEMPDYQFMIIVGSDFQNIMK